jgi:hypothetical protein
MTKEYKLISPITLGDENIEIVKLSEPECSKLKKYNVDLSEEALCICEGQSRIVLACAENIHEGHVLKMKARDLVKCSRECLSFFFQGREDHPQ